MTAVPGNEATFRVLAIIIAVLFLAWCLAGMSPWLGQIPGLRQWWAAHR